LVLELRTIDGAGKKYQNFFRIGTVGVFREDGKYVPPVIITNGRSLDGFQPPDFFAQITEILQGKGGV
jgi:hypothetical protein